MTLRLGTRASRLATWQAQWVADRLTEQGRQVELVPITTSGDRSQQGLISEIGGQGVFTKEIQNALLDGRIDLAVHSLKDLSTEPVPGLCLAAVPPRGPIGDVLVFGNSAIANLDNLPRGATIGTGSPRRKTQLLHIRPDLRVENIRGNVETRLAKLDADQFDALMLAEAGLQRLGFESRIGQVLPLSLVMPAVGQGALAIETRQDDVSAREAVQAIDDPVARASVTAERAMLAALQGGCSAPVAGWGRIEEGRLQLSGRVLRLDGSQCIEASLDGPLDAPEALGRTVARQLIDDGAAELILEARRG